MVEIKKFDGGHPLLIWEDQEKIKQLFAPQLTQDEFSFFMSMGMQLKANPFKREIWAVKYGTSPAQIFCGRDLYRRVAQEQENYEGHLVDAVYENDSFSVRNGEVNHEYGLKNRGRLIGAYCIVYKKGLKPFFNLVKLSEYSTGKSLWNEQTGKPETMIKKVAESQTIRAAFQGIYAGTYDESENWIEAQEVNPIQQAIQPTVVRNTNSKELSKDRFEKAIKAFYDDPIKILKSLEQFDLTTEQNSELEKSVFLQMQSEMDRLEHGGLGAISLICENYKVTTEMLDLLGLKIENGELTQITE